MNEELLGAIARGWCSEKNSSKIMDSDLALAIAEEVEPLITSTRLSAYKEGQRDMREEVVKMAEGMNRPYDVENGVSRYKEGKDMWGEGYAQTINDEVDGYNQAIGDLISEIGKGEYLSKK